MNTFNQLHLDAINRELSNNVAKRSTVYLKAVVIGKVGLSKGAVIVSLTENCEGEQFWLTHHFDQFSAKELADGAPCAHGWDAEENRFSYWNDLINYLKEFDAPVEV